ncbi:LamG domain-containing protein [Streptomyces anthocyanicus]|uniref:LamG domain-containing protein n=1 Tax=Streptomyces anthocyanicus TaxID=68174 RepID=UPI002DDA35ED|nr:LamG domain-containing protein [Streptomyces anthocyanicus]WSB66474.1 LamG domain-containing protein [Streptomyces anthocyanicus]
MTAVVCAAVVATLVPGPLAYGAGDEAADVPLSEGQQALEAAQESGQRVEVTGERTERTTVFANPDGSTFTLEESAVPVRVQASPAGDWTAPDATLEKRPDGTVAPKGAAVQMALSGGGEADPLAQIEDDGRSLALDWPGKLPAPSLDGPRAVYAEVLPGVDLQVTVTPESFQPIFVVKTPEAAASDELERLTFGLTTSNVTVREGAAGNLAAVDGNGTTVFKAPPARMWDSAGQDAADAGAQLQLMTADDTPADEPADPSEAAPSGSGLEPGQGDTVARMDVEVGDGSLSVTPDPDMLTSTDESAFPLFIDPTVTWDESERTLLRSDGYESYGWGNGDDGRGKGVGKCGSWSGYYCGPGYVQRLYFEFSPASLKGKQVLDATFRVTEPWAFQCDPRWVDLVRTNNISSATTWSSRPKELDWMSDRYVSAGRGSACDPNSPDAPIEFHDNPEETNENLTPTMKNFAAGKFSRLTLELRAHDEGDTSAWKRFKNDAVLAVDFVGLPEKPGSVGLQGGGTSTEPVCDKNAGDPAIMSDPTPLLKATARTKSGGGGDAQLRVYFDVDVQNADKTWTDVTPGNGSLSPSTGYVGDGRTVSLTWSKLADGKLYRYHAWTWSYYGSSHLSSAASDGYCYFRIDSMPPKPPQVTISAPYSACTSDACAAGGGPGVAASLTFKPSSGDANSAYQYKLSSDAAWSAELKGATVTTTVTPGRAGLHRVYVRAKDTLGWGGQSVTDFLVDSGDAPVGRYHFDEASGAAVDSATVDGRDDATLYGQAVRDDRGRRGVITHDSADRPLNTPVTDQGLSVNGSTGYASTAGQVLETRASYTLSTWVRLSTTPTRNLTVLSQNGAHRSPFYLGYEHAANAWALRAVNQDAPVGGNWTYQQASAAVPPVVGAWTHLTGVYDAQAQEIRLYVNGILQGSAPYTTAWAAAGPLQFGRTQWSDTYTDYFAGSIDETAVWQRALSPEEIADEAALSNSPSHAAVELVADWSADQRSGGSTLPDTTSGYGRALSLTGGATLDGQALVFDGVDDAATTPGPVIDDTGSFTVTALVALDSDKLLAKPVGYTGQVLGQRTADGSAWGIWYERTGSRTVLDESTGELKSVPEGFWRFGRLNADGTFTAVASSEAAVMDTTVRLTGIFDAQTRTVSLYLSRSLDGALEAFTAKAGSGDFSLGKGFSKDTWQHFLPAGLVEARVWAGAMATPEQVGEIVGD